ncbi:hypothetical protein MJD09_12990 [bacterium]|nr:hypothetical protein [bacterium]
MKTNSLSIVAAMLLCVLMLNSCEQSNSPLGSPESEKTDLVSSVKEPIKSNKLSDKKEKSGEFVLASSEVGISALTPASGAEITTSSSSTNVSWSVTADFPGHSGTIPVWDWLRVWIDGQIVYDSGQKFLPVEKSENGTKTLSVGEHTIKAEARHRFKDAIYPHTHYEHSGPIVENTFSVVQLPSTPTLDYPIDGGTAESSIQPFRWDASSGSSPITYQLQVDNNSNFSSPHFDQSGLSGTSKVVTGLTHNIRYYWRMKASNSGGSSSWSNVWSVNIPPEVPSVTPSITPGGNPKLSWSAVSGAAEYEVYRQINDGGSWQLVSSTTSTSYTDSVEPYEYYGTSPPNGPYRAYKVRTENTQGYHSHYSSPIRYFVSEEEQPEP